MSSCPPRSNKQNDTPDLEVSYRNSYAIVSLTKEPVNTLNLHMWEQLSVILDLLEGDTAVRGVIFQSGLQRDVFTAGNDIMELYAPNTSKERYRCVVNFMVFLLIFNYNKIVDFV